MHNEDPKRDIHRSNLHGKEKQLKNNQLAILAAGENSSTELTGNI